MRNAQDVVLKLLETQWTSVWVCISVQADVTIVGEANQNLTLGLRNKRSLR